MKRFFKSLDPPNSAKRMRVSQKSPEILVEIPIENSDEPSRILRGLLDSGSTGCILLNEFTKGLKKRFGTTERWMTCTMHDGAWAKLLTKSKVSVEIVI